MSDFLVSFDRRYGGRCLLDLLGTPYAEQLRAGHWRDYSWGSVAVLEDHLANGKNIVQRQGHVIAWVGDLLTEMSEGYVDDLAQHLAEMRAHGMGEGRSVDPAGLVGRLDGAFAVIVADQHGLCIVTDVQSSVRVYAGYDASGKMVAVGTHQDLVAAVSGWPPVVDVNSAAEFLTFSGVSYPHTMYGNVECMAPGSIHAIKCSGGVQSGVEVLPYWQVPGERQSGYDEDDLAEELRQALVAGVRDRCRGGKIAVALSGGLDSRLIMALVPKSIECIGLTFCDQLNRETDIARRVAQAYGRPWFPIFRDPEHVARAIEPIVRLSGCEGWFVHAHGIGLAEQIAEHHVTAILNGLYMDRYLKCYRARDMVRIPRLWGLLPPRYEGKALDLTAVHDGVWSANLQAAVLDGMRARRAAKLNRFADPGRTSPADWFGLYPVLYGFAGWAAERRMVPVTLPALTRRLIEFAFRCPVSLKLGKRIFIKATRDLYGTSRRIPDANDGVRPGSGHWSRLAQRAIREAAGQMAKMMESPGRQQGIQHSWHDYERYWKESKEISRLIEAYGPNLDQLDGRLFKVQQGRDLLKRRDIEWRYGSRLLQVAVWLDTLRSYRVSGERDLPRAG